MKFILLLFLILAIVCILTCKLTPYWEVDVYAGAPFHIEILDMYGGTLFNQDVYNRSIHVDIHSEFIRVIVYPIQPEIAVAKMTITKNYMAVFEMERVIQMDLPWQVDANTIDSYVNILNTFLQVFRYDRLY